MPAVWTIVVYDLAKNRFSFTGVKLTYREANHIAKNWPRSLDQSVAIACEYEMAMDLHYASSVEETEEILTSAEAIRELGDSSSVYIIQKLCTTGPVTIPHIYRSCEAINYWHQSTRLGLKIALRRIILN